ncbi:hypothetical protein F5Y10DRAFT_269323 [Nemania abortiva]|nr:hypothetical protein F5Y10DRAFT_269323 [Nemania abortiva]
MAVSTMAASIISGPPFLISITGKTNTSIKGYAEACRAGTGGSYGLCYDALDQPPKDSGPHQFWYEVSNGANIKDDYLLYMLPINGSYSDGPFSAMQLRPALGSNVNMAFIPLGIDRPTSFDVSDEDGKIYLADLEDDRNYSEKMPESRARQDADNFHVCWQWVGPFWKYSVAWVTVLPPQNPTCEPVELRLVGWGGQFGTRAA